MVIITELVNLMKKAAVDAVNQTKPMELIFGKVIQEEDIPKNIPLLIRIEQKKPMPRAFFIENRYLDSLKLNDRLILLRVQGGQAYYIMEVLKSDTE